MVTLISAIALVWTLWVLAGCAGCIMMVSTAKQEPAEIVVVHSSLSSLFRGGRHCNLRRSMVTTIAVWQGGVVLNSGPFPLVVVLVPVMFRWLLVYRLQQHFPYSSVRGEGLNPPMPFFNCFIKIRCWLRNLA